MPGVPSASCNYSDPRLGLRCDRPPTGNSKCSFHDPGSDSSTPMYRDLFQKLIDAKDGKWCGFKLPDDLRLEAHVFDFPIDARAANGPAP